MKKTQNQPTILMIDAFSTLHVGNGALIDNTYKLCKQYLGEDVEILSIDAPTNEGRFPVVRADIFTDYGGTFIQKLKKALSIIFFFIIEYLNTILFRSKLRLPWPKRFADFLSAVDRADICVSLSGETINDHYRPHMYLRLLTYYLTIVKGKKFIVFPQSIGPVFRPTSKWLLRKTLGDAHTIFARDIPSFELARALWSDKTVSIVFCPDVATTQESTPQPLPTSTREKTIGLTVSDIPKAEMGVKNDYLPALLGGIANALDKERFNILLMPSNYRHGSRSADYATCLEAKKFLEERGFSASILPDQIVHPDAYQGLQKNLYAFLSTRMHVGILATSAGIPTLMINTQHKIRSYMSLIGMDDFTVELDQLHTVPEKLNRLINENEDLRFQLKKGNDLLRQQVTDAMITLSESLLEQQR